jgi:hypothetical protein
MDHEAGYRTGKTVPVPPDNSVKDIIPSGERIITLKSCTGNPVVQKKVPVPAITRNAGPGMSVIPS